MIQLFISATGLNRDSFNVTVIPRDSGPENRPLSRSTSGLCLILNRSPWELTFAQMWRLCAGVQRSVCCWKPWLQRRRPLCERSSAAVVRSIPQAAVTHTHRCIFYNATHGHVRASTDASTRTHARARTPTRTHSSGSKKQSAVMDKQQARRPARHGDNPAAWLRSHQNTLFVTRLRKTCLSCCPLRVYVFAVSQVQV